MLQSAAASIAKAAGWTAPAPDAAGVVTFRLAEGLRLELFSPDGRTIILCGVVRSLPEEEHEADALVEKALRHAAAKGRRRSTLSLSPAAPSSTEGAGTGGAREGTSVEGETEKQKRKLTLHRVLQGFEKNPHKDAFFAGEAEGILNDLAWWRACLGEDPLRNDSGMGFDGGLASFPALHI